MRKKIYSLSIAILASYQVFSQNNQINPQVQINNDQQINAPANQQDIALNNNSFGNNPPSTNINVYTQQAVQPQVQINTSNQNVGTINFGSGNRSAASYSTSSSHVKNHSLKLNLHLNKIHIARRFFHTFPLFQSKTYKHIFRSKKRSIKHCFRF